MKENKNNEEGKCKTDNMGMMKLRIMMITACQEDILL